MDDISKEVLSGKNPGGIRGFPSNVQSMFIATYTALLLYFLFLLLKHILNAMTSRGSGGYYGGASAAEGGVGPTGYEGFRKSRKKGFLAPTPPPPPPSAQPQQPGVGSTTGLGISGAGGGGAFGGPGTDGNNHYGTQGMETEKGSPYDTYWSEALSRAADVMRLAFLVLLGGTVLNAFSFDASGAANALAWILFSLFVLWALLALFMPNRWVPLLMSLFMIGVAIPFYAVGFSIADGPLITQ